MEMMEKEISEYCQKKITNKNFFWMVGLTNDNNILPIGKNWKIWDCKSFEEANKLRTRLILNFQMDNYTPHSN
jgi:hypothetical protein